MHWVIKKKNPINTYEAAWCSTSSHGGVTAAAAQRGEEAAQLDSRALNLPVDLISRFHPEPRALDVGSDGETSRMQAAEMSGFFFFPP